MVDKKPDKDEPQANETDRRDRVRDQGELERARGRGWHSPPAAHADERTERRKVLSGTRAWRTDHTEVMLVELPEPDQFVYLRVTDVTTWRYVQAPLTADDLEIVAHVLQLHAARLRRLAERR